MSSISSSSSSVVQTQTSASQITLSWASSSTSSALSAASSSSSSTITSVEPAAPFPKMNVDTSLHILSYLKYSELSRFVCVSKGAYELRDSENFQLERGIFSTIRIFDRTHWKEYYNAEVTDEYDASKIDATILRDFLKAYYGPNPIGSGRVCDNCLTPTVVPRGIWFKIQSGYFYENHSLSLLGKLAEHPLKGHAAKYVDDQSEALQQHGMTPASGSSRLVIQLKDVIGRSKPWSKESQNPDKRGQVQILSELFARTGWGRLPDALTQNTVVFAHHAITGARPLGDKTGIEGTWTFGRTVELVRHEYELSHMVSGGFKQVDPVGGSAPAGLHLDYSDFVNDVDGVPAVREF